MDGAAADRDRVIERALKRILPFALAAGHRGKTGFALAAERRVDAELRQAVRVRVPPSPPRLEHHRETTTRRRQNPPRPPRRSAQSAGARRTDTRGWRQSGASVCLSACKPPVNAFVRQAKLSLFFGTLQTQVEQYPLERCRPSRVLHRGIALLSLGNCPSYCPLPIVGHFVVDPLPPAWFARPSETVRNNTA